VPLTTGDVLALPDLRLDLLAGRAGLDREVRWAHVIELADPVPWLRGGELVLTVGLGLPDDAPGQRSYVRGLADAGCAGLVFPPGEVRADLPPEVLRTADDLAFPVIAVRPPTPFVAITEAVAQWYAEARSRDVRKVISVQDATARAALRTGARGILRELADGTGGEALLLTARGEVRTAAPAAERPWHAAVTAAIADRHRGALSLRHADLDVHVQSLGFGPLLGWLAVAHPSPLPEPVRMLANHTACLIGLEMAAVRAARARTQDQRATLFAALLDGATPRLDELLPLPPAPYEVLVLRADGRSPSALADPALDTLADLLPTDPPAEDRVVVCPRPEGLVVVLPDRRPRLGAALTDRLRTRTGRTLHAAAVHARDTTRLPAAVTTAATLADRDHPGYAHADDLTSWSLLEESLPPDAARRFTDHVLDRLRDHDARTPSALIPSLRAYLDAAGNLESAAHSLGIHRNTLRTRLRTTERITGRTLTNPRDRLELWLAVTLTDA